MLISILKGKIHRATVTEANIHYMGSITIDEELMEHAGMLPYEKVLVVSLESGERLETYVIKGKRGSKAICLNGAAARKILKDDKVIILSFALIDEEEAKTFKPRVVYVDSKNNIINEMDHVKKEDEC
ncbi:MAG TPA: aspartate 1-decarboxylase [Actinobacteria bacterium]|nr:aspartate 1-decarboxylase [Actinomycetota bacterium]